MPYLSRSNNGAGPGFTVECHLVEVNPAGDNDVIAAFAMPFKGVVRVRAWRAIRHKRAREVVNLTRWRQQFRIAEFEDHLIIPPVAVRRDDTGIDLYQRRLSRKVDRRDKGATISC